MKYAKILIDGLDLVIVRGGNKIQYYTNYGAMATEIARIAVKHPKWHVTFEEVEVHDTGNSAKQVIHNHEKLHNPYSSWEKCTHVECVQLQIAIAAHRAKKNKEVETSV